eukprot:Amastigsp_a695521_3.p5 type:complete len:117 gc:universal Amastigsp_a695521_3:538-888(+)
MWPPGERERAQRADTGEQHGRPHAEPEARRPSPKGARALRGGPRARTGDRWRRGQRSQSCHTRAVRSRRTKRSPSRFAKSSTASSGRQTSTGDRTCESHRRGPSDCRSTRRSDLDA